MFLDNIDIANVGCRYYKDNPTKTGGVVVLFEQWIGFCSSLNINIRFTTIDSNKSNYKNKAVGLIEIIIKLLKFSIRRTKRKIIILHSTYFDIIFLAPIVIILGKLLNVGFVIRKFAGNFEDLYNNANPIIKTYLHYILSSADLIFWESKSLVKFGKKHNVNSEWFPNVRKQSLVHRNPQKEFKRRFVFISRVEKEKGVLDLAECLTRLGEQYSLDIYGPISGIKINEIESQNVRYRGTLRPELVSETLCKYDVLCLPTYWEGEGYPGIIIEAFSVGIPVISTYKGGIPELIEDNSNGFLVTPQNIDELRNAILKITCDNYASLSQNALHTFNNYNADIVNEQIIRLITKI